MNIKSNLKLAALAFMASAGMVSSASASGGFEQARFGSEHGHAAGDTPFALYYNPAALSFTKRLNVAAHLTLAWHGASFDRKESDTTSPAEASDANLGKAKVSDALAAPALAAAYRLGDFVIGAGVFVPFAGLQSWSADGPNYPRYPGTRDSTARWHFIEGGITSLYASIGASYTIQPIRLSLGVSANLNHTTLDFTRAYPNASDNIVGEGRSHLDVAATTGSFGLGVLWEAIERKAWVGLSYQAPPGMYKDMDMEGKLRISAGTANVSTNVTLKQSMPDIIRLALRVRPTDRYELRLAGDITRWSVFERQCLVARGGSCDVQEDGSSPSGRVSNNQPRDWQNTFGVRAGGSYFFSPRYEAFAGVYYDSNAIPAGTLDPSVIDGHDLTYTLGGRVRFADMFGVLLAASYQHWLERDTTDLSRLSSYEEPSRLASSGGIYNQQAFLFNAMLEFYLN